MKLKLITHTILTMMDVNTHNVCTKSTSLHSFSVRYFENDIYKIFEGVPNESIQIWNN